MRRVTELKSPVTEQVPTLRGATSHQLDNQAEVLSIKIPIFLSTRDLMYMPLVL
jgi:hypothetical protein